MRSVEVYLVYDGYVPSREVFSFLFDVVVPACAAAGTNRFGVWAGSVEAAKRLFERANMPLFSAREVLTRLGAEGEAEDLASQLKELLDVKILCEGKEAFLLKPVKLVDGALVKLEEGLVAYAIFELSETFAKVSKRKDFRDALEEKLAEISV